MANNFMKQARNRELQTTNSAARINEALALIRLGQVRHVAQPPAPLRRGGEIVDLPRICAVHDKPYAARYVSGADGRFHYAQTIKVTEALYLEQYADNRGQVWTLQDRELGEEFCPWCGGHGRGSVCCGTCGKEICYGKSVGRYFRCRDSCGGEGTMVPQGRTHTGVKPGPLTKNGFST